MERNEYRVDSYQELNNLQHNKIIDGHVIINGNIITTLFDINEINGSLCLENCSVIDLGDLRVVKGNFVLLSYKVESKLETLKNLEFVGGDLLISKSNVSSLGKLKHVGKTINISHTKISSLDNLEYIGSDLNVRFIDDIELNNLTYIGNNLLYPKRFENKLKEHKNLLVKGTTYLYKHVEWKREKEKKIEGLSKSLIPIVHWNHTYIYRLDDLNYANEEQKEFFNHFKDSFFKEVYIDLDNNSNYIFVLFYYILEQYNKKNNIQWLENNYNLLSKYYPITNSYCISQLIEVYEKIEDFESAWELITINKRVNINTTFNYTKFLKRRLLNEGIILKLVDKSYLTTFGRKNIEKVKKYLIPCLDELEEKYNSSFFEIFVNPGLEIGSDEYFEYYEQFYVDNTFDYYKEIDSSLLTRNYKGLIMHIYEHAIINQFEVILRNAENRYRKEISMKNVGDEWIQESELYNKLIKEFPNLRIIKHASIRWLGRQHLDVYMPELNLGIEYQGEQHFRPIEFFGGEKAFEKITKLDKKKKELCKKNNCELIYLRKGYDFISLIKKINKRR